MPEQQPVYSATTGQPAGSLPVPTPDQAYAAALVSERAGYVALAATGQTQRGGEPIADIIARIDGELTRLGVQRPDDETSVWTEDAPVPALPPRRPRRGA